ncbi:hypothetical protein GCM10011428_39970 [Streptomyces violaceus]|uniref:hypothetical protein n=1 Tax=Streptomyces violaceus TaxID=1936 RepID=UPI0031EE2FED
MATRWLAQDAPREVKEVKLREVMRTPVWSDAPPALRRQAEVIWTKTADEILDKVAAYCRRISDSGH